MIYKNYKLYDLTTDESYIKLKKYCEELGYPVLLKRNPKFTKKIKKVGKGQGFKTHIPPKFFDYNATERAAGGSNTWRYSLHPIKKDKEGYPEFEGDHGEFFNTLGIQFKEHDLEKLWFLLTKSNMVNGRGVYFIHDPEKNYRERAKNDSNSIGVKFYIMSEHSPLSDSQLRVVGKYFGLSKVDDMTHAKLQSILFDHIESLERSRQKGYEKFMIATKLDKFITFKASLQDAIDQQIIGWLPRNLTWNWLDSEGKPLTLICQITSSDEKYKTDVLMDFIMASDELTERLQKELGGESPDAGIVFDASKLELDKDNGGYTYPELQKLCKNIPGYNPSFKKGEEIILKLKEFHNVE